MGNSEKEKKKKRKEKKGKKPSLLNWLIIVLTGCLEVNDGENERQVMQKKQEANPNNCFP